MDKNLYVSYQCFKENPEYGIVAKMNNGQEYFYQVMADSYKIVRHKWEDTCLVTSLNKEDIISFRSLNDYLKEQEQLRDISDPNLFLELTQVYNLPLDILKTVSKDINTSNMSEDSNSEILLSIKKNRI